MAIKLGMDAVLNYKTGGVGGADETPRHRAGRPSAGALPAGLFAPILRASCAPRTPGAEPCKPEAMPQRPAFHEDLARQEEVESSSDRSFGVVFAVVFTIIGLWPLLHGEEARTWSLVVAAVFLLAALAVPGVLAPLNRLWLRFGALLHRIVSPIILALLFYGVVLPTGLLMRLFGKRTIPTGFDAQAESYWTPRDPPGPAPEGMKNQF